jgi:NitT/TauT family transport system substrate-binding protein
MAVWALATVVAGGGSAPAIAKDLFPITFQLNWSPAGFNSGFELAVEKGFYRDAGLDVTIEPGNGSQIAAQLVAAGKADLAYIDSAAVMNLIAAGAKMKVVATILQGNPIQVTALKKTRLKSVADMRGRSVGLPNAGSQAAMFRLVLAANGLTENDIKLVNMPIDTLVPSLLQGTVEVILGSTDYFGILLKNAGAETDDFLFIDSGAPTVSTSIVASDAILQARPEVVRAFVAASLKGWNAAVADPAAAVAAMKKMFPDANEKLGPDQIAATKALMCVNRAKFVGKATPAQWDDTAKIFAKIGTLPADIPATAYYTYDYLPAESELVPCPLK